MILPHNSHPTKGGRPPNPNGYRRGLLTNVSSAVDDATVDVHTYGYDALGLPVHRNYDTFGYNERGGVVFSRGDAETAEYSYDDIGNLKELSSAITNLYIANTLNQYTSIQSSSALSATPCEINPQYDFDGNLLTDGNLAFTYDSANRLKTVSSNGVLLVTNFYDAKSRRVKKVTQEATTTFFYDDWNLIEERVAYTNGTSSTIRYYWGKDLSGELQGAGGVGGLLFLTVDDAIYIPCYDNNGNVTKYVDANGNIVASYTYDAFGKLISKSGSLADFFRHRFSTKYFDAETGLYYYGYRFYHPTLMRWLNRDPIGEDGGLNLYGFIINNPYFAFDKLGLYRWVAIYYSRLDQSEFRRAAETYKKQIENRASFNPKCDKVIIKGVLSDDDFSKVWNDVLNETNKDGPQYKIKDLHIFSHSGPGMLFFRGGSMTSDKIQKLPRLNWASDGSVVNHGCNSGLHDEDGNSVAKSFAKGQGVLSKGQTGFSQFSENPQKRTWFTRVDAGSNDVYLWSFGDGGPKWTFGTARPTNDERP